MQEIYDQMWQNAVNKYQLNEFEYDQYLNGKIDTRRGITLLARPTKETRHKIVQFLNEFSDLEPDQYCHPESDLHITIMSIVACREQYELASVQQYREAVQRTLKGVSPFTVVFEGITASPNCVLIQGYTQDESLSNLREGIRQEFSNNQLEHSMDTRYTIKTAHSSVIRYRKPPVDPAKLIAFLRLNKDRYFGEVKITELELVFNDWYQRKENTEVLARFNLNV